MNKKTNKTNILRRISSIMMIILAIACNILTVALLSTTGCVKTPIQKEQIISQEEVSKHFMYVNPENNEENASIQDTDIYYAINVVVSDKNGKASFIKIKPPLVIKTK
tara:strand:- start:2946 stop:3269 length:324 start_codon:yes stop_codon:yes gene_type:complete